jgi:ferritin-like metal-binding protein YciE
MPKKSVPAKSATRNASRSQAAAGRSMGSAGRGASSASRTTKAAANPRNDLETILIDLMKDIYYAEKKITKALAKMSKKCSNDQLRDAFDTHRSQTDDQIQKLERAFELIGQKVKAKKCAAMDGLVEESDEHMKEFQKGAGLDVALLVGAQKVEHYEIAAYGSMRSIADTLGYTEAAGIFEDILEQERDTDERLTQIAESVVNLEAEDEKDGEDVTSGKGNSRGGADSEAGEDSSSAVSGNKRGQGAGVEDNDGAGRGISSLTDGNDRGETGPAMGY